MVVQGRQTSGQPGRRMRASVPPSPAAAAPAPAIVAERGRTLIGHPLLNKGTAFSERSATRSACAGSSRQGSAHRRAGRAGARACPPQGGRSRALHRPGGAPGSQRDALLPRARRQPRGAHAHRLHADGRAGPARSTATSSAARAASGSRPSTAAASTTCSPARPRRRAPDRRHRQRAHPGPRRPGRGRHGHPGRQAGALHRGRGHPPGADPARSSLDVGTDNADAARGPLYLGYRRAAPARRGVRRASSRSSSQAVRARLPARAPPVGGLQAAQRLPPARPLPRRAAQLQRRHPGHRRRSCSPASWRARRSRRTLAGAAHRVPRAPARPASASRACCERRLGNAAGAPAGGR